MARRDMDRYLESGPDTTTRLLLEGLSTLDLRDATLLDIGAGIGVIHHELIGQGIGRAVHVEASDAYIAEARSESVRRGNAERVHFVSGDFVNRASALEPTDVVTLDRVICCYPDYAALVSRSAEKARRYFAMSVPRHKWYLRAGGVLENLKRRLEGDAFRTFVHPTSALDRLLRLAGFVRRWHRTTFAWEVSVYARNRD